MVLKGTIQTWGNSLALRIPKAVSEDLGLEQNAGIEIIVDDGLLVVKPTTGRKKRLKKLLSKITRENVPDEKELFGRRIGKEW